MWKVVNIDAQKYFIKRTSSVDSHKICITNFINIWIEDLPSITLLQRCKVQNPLIEADSQSLIEHILSLIDGYKKDVTITSNIHQDFLYLIVKSKLADAPFAFTFNLKLMHSEELYAEVTRPLVLLVQDLHRRQDVLSSLLENKDAEIAEYKLEGAQIKRKKVETDVFNREQFVKRCLEQPIPTEILKEPICAFSRPVCEALAAVTTQYHTTQQKTLFVSSSPPCPHSDHSEIAAEIVHVPDCTQKEKAEVQTEPVPVNVQLEAKTAKKRKTAPKPKLRL